MRGPEALAAIETEHESFASRPVEVPVLKPLTVEAIENREIPGENVNM